MNLYLHVDTERNIYCVITSSIIHNTPTSTVTHIHIHNRSTHPFYCHDVTHNYSSLTYIYLKFPYALTSDAIFT